jgi:hypothetical protein
MTSHIVEADPLTKMPAFDVNNSAQSSKGDWEGIWKQA